QPCGGARTALGMCIAETVRRILIVALAGLLLAPNRAAAAQPAKTRVQISARVVRLVAGPVAAEIRRAPLRPRLLARGPALGRDPSGGGPFYERGRPTHRPGAG